MNEEELEAYFKSDKSDWYSVISGSNKLWKEHKVKEFWALIRKHKVSRKDLKFDGYIFPKSEMDEKLRMKPENLNETYDFWTKGHSRIFSNIMSFKNVVFFRNAQF